MIHQMLRMFMGNRYSLCMNEVQYKIDFPLEEEFNAVIVVTKSLLINH